MSVSIRCVLTFCTSSRAPIQRKWNWWHSKWNANIWWIVNQKWKELFDNLHTWTREWSVPNSINRLYDWMCVCVCKSLDSFTSFGSLIYWLPTSRTFNTELLKLVERHHLINECSAHTRCIVEATFFVSTLSQTAPGISFSEPEHFPLFFFSIIIEMFDSILCVNWISHHHFVVAAAVVVGFYALRCVYHSPYN